jgi:hypothetical protein
MLIRGIGLILFYSAHDVDPFLQNGGTEPVDDGNAVNNKVP